MFSLSPFRRIKELEFEIESKDRKIEDLRSPTRPKYHPNETCTDCEYCIIEEQTQYGNVVYKGYYCRLNNNCEDYTLKE